MEGSFFTDILEQQLSSGIPLLAYPIVFVGGLLTGLTPCVYPLIPITIGYIGAKGCQSKMKAFLISLCYVLGIAVTYSILGMIAALSGRVFGTIVSNKWFFIIGGNICLLLALSMFDVFYIPTPAFLSKLSVGKDKGAYIGAFLMGLVFGVLMGPCTAPVLGVILFYVASTKSLFLGGSLLFVFAIGVGGLLLVVGTFSGLISTLPNAGKWMDKIKKAMAICLLIVAEYFLIKSGSGFF